MTFSSGGRDSGADLSVRNNSAKTMNLRAFSPESLSIIVEKILMILMAVERACYANATRPSSSPQSQSEPLSLQSKPKRKGGAHS